MYAPIIVFAYNRADRVEKLIDSLSKNPEAIESQLYIFSDGAKTEAGAAKVEAVRQYIDTVSAMKLFADVHIVKAEKNKGLANSIIDGVTYVMNEHGKAIIIEDDNVVASDFLDYMNRGLEYYKDDPKIWAISGFSREMTFPDDYNHDIYVMQRISSYTWASWRDRWEKTEWNVPDYPRFLFDRKARRRFAECGEDRPLMLDAQMCGKISSWAIRFEYSMVKNDMYSILPCVSRAVCSGNDGSGTHSTKAIDTFNTFLSDGSKLARFENLIQDERIREEFVKPYKRKIKRKLLGNADFIFMYFKNKRKN